MEATKKIPHQAAHKTFKVKPNTIKHMVIDKEMKLYELAERCGLAYPFVIQIANGRIHTTEESAKKIAKALDTELETIFYEFERY